VDGVDGEPVCPAPHHSKLARRLWLAVALIWALPAVALFFAVNLLPNEVPPGRCQGIGFGCTLAPNDRVLFMGYVYYFWSVPVGIIVLGLIAVMTTLRSSTSP
jgi:hypothetical protein